MLTSWKKEAVKKNAVAFAFGTTVIKKNLSNANTHGNAVPRLSESKQSSFL